MPIFEFDAKDETGQVKRGTHVAPTLEQAQSDILARGWTIAQLQLAGSMPVAPQPVRESMSPSAAQQHEGGVPEAPVSDLMYRRSYLATDVIGTTVYTVPLAALSFFFRQYAMMIHAGVSPTQSLSTLADQTQSGKLSNILRELSQHALEGRPISFGMQRYPDVFTPLQLSLVRVGERSGNVEETCKLASQYIDREIEVRNLIKRVTFMPKLTVAMSVIIIVATNLIIKSIAKGGTTLWTPLAEASTWMVLGPAIIALYIFFKVGLANYQIRTGWHTLISNIPYIGGTIRQFAMAKFGTAFGTLYRSGVPIGESLHLAADACGNEYLRGKIVTAIPNLESGMGMKEALTRTGAFSPIVLDMVSTGEMTGSLEQMLEKVAEYYEGEADLRATKLGHVVGVVVLVITAIYVAIVYITNMINIVATPINDAMKGN